MLRVLMQAPEVTPTKLKLTCHEYGYYVDKETKKKTFGVLGERKLQEFIHSFAADCDYSLIMKSLLPSVAEFDDFGDVLDIAEDIKDCNDILPYTLVLQEHFNSLPLEVKEHYANDYSIFAADVISGRFTDYVTEKYKPKQASQSASVNPDLGDKRMEGSGTGSQSGGDGDLRELVGQLRGELAELRSKAQSSGGEA